MRISDWSSDVCSSDLQGIRRGEARGPEEGAQALREPGPRDRRLIPTHRSQQAEIESREMPKNKTHSGAKKRFRVTGSGKILRETAGKRHNPEKKPSKETRRVTESERPSRRERV